MRREHQYVASFFLPTTPDGPGESLSSVRAVGGGSASTAILSYNAAHACHIWGNDEGRRHGA